MPTVLWRFLSRSLYQFFVIFLLLFVCFYVSSARDMIKYIKSLLVLVYYCKSHSAALDRDERSGV